MKKEVIDKRVGSFVDFTGKERKFIIVAVSSSTEVYKRMISIGVSVCHADDKFDEQVGTNIAIRNAKKSNLKFYASVAGMVNTKVVSALLDQEMEYFINNPASHIPGYNQMSRDYTNNQVKIQNLINIKNDLTQDEQKLFEEFKKLPDDTRNKIKVLLNAKELV